MKMRMIRFCVLSSLLLALCSGFALPQGNNIQALEMSQPPEVPYQKWGETSVLLAKESFPNYKVSDYKYLGRQKKTATTAQDRFELVLTQDTKKRDIIVTILFNTRNGELISASVSEK